MKTKQFLSVLVLVAVVGIATAVERPKMNVIRLSDETALIAVANENPAYFELTIKAENGDLMYYKESEKEITNLRQIIDYSNLKAGSYSLKLKVNDTFLSTDFEIGNNGMNVWET